MEKMSFKDVMKKCFGKNKDDRWHAVAMLILYGIFFLVAYLVLTFGSTSVEKEATPTPTPKVEENYTYSYKITYDDTMEEILGKKIGNKEKLVYTDYINGYSTYVIMNGVIYKIEDNKEVKVDKISDKFKYYVSNKVLEIKEDNPVTVDNTYIYEVSNSKLASIFGDTIASTNPSTSQIFIVKDKDNITSIRLDLDSYIKDVTGEEHTLKVEMSYTDIGTTTDFEILVD